ncbi:MAG: hypothetical protein KGZ82_04210 [Bacteroidales bacterium]|nr:hypothetical protein [Bacteroidales bacterium]
MTDQDKLTVEKRAIETLLSHGMTFRVGRIKFLVKQPYLGTLLHLSKIYAEIAIDEEKLKDSAYAGSFVLVQENAVRVSRMIAIAVLNGKWKIRLFTGILSNYFLWRINPEKLFGVMGIVIALSNTASFTNSIRLIQALRLMKPKEENLSRDITGD